MRDYFVLGAGFERALPERHRAYRGFEILEQKHHCGVGETVDTKSGAGSKRGVVVMTGSVMIGVRIHFKDSKIQK